MTYRGTFKGGVIVLEPGAKLAEGQQVDITPTASEQGPTLYERLMDVMGIAPGLPEDMAENHDHYIHGCPKRSTP